MFRIRRQDVGTWRLVAQRVVTPSEDAAAAVAHLGAVQAQDLRAAATAVALRTATPTGTGTPTGLAAALDAGTVVRSWPMRGTLHLLRAVDLPWVLALCGPRTIAATRRRREQLSISDADLAVARETVLAHCPPGGTTRAAVLAALEAVGQATGGGRGYHLLHHLALTGDVCLGPLAGREQLFVPSASWVQAAQAPPDPLAEWTRRYLRGHGPATPADAAFWTGLPLGTARRGFEAVRAEFDAVQVEGFDGAEHLVDPALPDLVANHRTAARRVHLLPGFDEFLLGYADRSAVLDPEFAGRLTPGGNGVFRGTVVAGGRVVGAWTRAGDHPAVEEFVEFSAARRAALGRRARTLPSGWLGGHDRPARTERS
ncbi:winged helix DNA-binding domain-containing protein [Kineococcus sp. TBRC 1896]|uniref:Winged helix DNA-binding domain-containing protein n=1 Tax=Kineococcus mangrovi TaxID=1660183 RepID=A0ABV4I568_9ACTN